MSTALEQLTERWRDEAALLRRYGDERGATACELHAAELESAIHSVAAEVLSLTAAARESGYSSGSLRRMVRDGVLPNCAEKQNDYAFRRSDLPRKPGRSAGTVSQPETQVAEDAPAVAQGQRQATSSPRQIARAIAQGEY